MAQIFVDFVLIPYSAGCPFDIRGRDRLEETGRQ